MNYTSEVYWIRFVFLIVFILQLPEDHFLEKTKLGIEINCNLVE